MEFTWKMRKPKKCTIIIRETKYIYVILVNICGTLFIPVSYTHLDVYKRQALPSTTCPLAMTDRLTQLQICLDQMTEQFCATLNYIDKNHSFDPVSYTHLDVYKRQEFK